MKAYWLDPPRIRSWVFTVCCCLIVSTALAIRATVEKSQEPLTSTICSAAHVSGDNRFILSGTLGQQSPVGLAQQGEWELASGFWSMIGSQEVTPVEPVIRPKNELCDCFPNPFNPSTTVEFNLASASRVSVQIYDVKGRLVRTLVNEMRESGSHREIWRGNDDSGRRVASGTYFCRLQAGDFSKTIKMLMVK